MGWILECRKHTPPPHPIVIPKRDCANNILIKKKSMCRFVCVSIWYLKCHEPCLWNEDGGDPIEHGVREQERSSCTNRKSPELRSPNRKSQPSIQEKWTHTGDSRELVPQLKLSSDIHCAPMILQIFKHWPYKLKTKNMFRSKKNIEGKSLRLIQ